MTTHPSDHWQKRILYAIDPPATSLLGNLKNSARCYPDKPALVFCDQGVSYSRLRQQVEQLAGALSHLGVSNGTVRC